MKASEIDIKEIDKKIKEEYGKDWKKTLSKQIEEESKKEEKKQRKLLKKFHSDQISYIKNYGNKRFEISQEFFDASMTELKRSFQYGDEMAMLLFFRENSKKIIGDEFYDTAWIEKKGLGYRTPLRMWIKNMKTGKESPYPLGCFAFHYNEIYEIMKNKKKLIICFHSHPSEAKLSSIDSEIKPYCQGIFGFERVSEELEKLTWKTFGAKDKKWKKWKAKSEDFIELKSRFSEENWKEFVKKQVGREIRQQIPFEVPENTYKNILEECKPTVRIFYTDNNKLIKIPIYLGNRILS